MDSFQAGDSRPGLLVSIIIPARNEEANIADCLRTLLAQGAQVEILVADDASEDRTAEIVSGMAMHHAAVRLVAVPPLPARWNGKNHALHVAAQQASGEWLLFTDADTRHAPGAVPILVARAEQEGLDMVSCSPPQQTATWWEKAVIPQVYQLLARHFPFERINDPADPLAAANGQFILIRRGAYQSIQGHEAVSGETLEDVELARRAKQAGLRLWFGPGEGIVSTRMYREFPAMWDGWTKNLFLLLGSNKRAVHRAAASLALRGWLPPVAGFLLLAGGFPLTWAAAAVWIYSLMEHLGYFRKLKAPQRFARTVLYAPGAFLLFLLLLNSERRYSQGLGIQWKGRRYSTGN